MESHPRNKITGKKIIATVFYEVSPACWDPNAGWSPADGTSVPGRAPGTNCRAAHGDRCGTGWSGCADGPCRPWRTRSCTASPSPALTSRRPHRSRPGEQNKIKQKPHATREDFRTNAVPKFEESDLRISVEAQSDRTCSTGARSCASICGRFRTEPRAARCTSAPCR